jgi:hypothetical protein
MKSERFIRLATLAVSLLALSMVFSLTGCGSDSSFTQSGQYQQKVYMIGEIIDPMTSSTDQQNEVAQDSVSAMEQIFVNIVPYDGVSTDAPIFIAADSVQSISQTMQEGIWTTYQFLNPIVVIHGGETEINAVLGMLGLEQDFKMPSGFPYAEIFAIDKEEGLNFRWVMLPVGSSDGNDPSNIDRDQAPDPYERAGFFRDWLSQNGSRVTSQLLADKQEAMDALSTAVTTSQEMTEWVKGYNSTFHLALGSNIYQFSYWIWAVHDFASRADWFYVVQDAQLNPSGLYKPYKVKTWYGAGYDVKEWYIYSYVMDNWMVGLKDPAVTLLRPSPPTTTTKTEITTGMDWDFTGNLGFEGTKPTGNVGVKLSIKNEKTIEVPECEVYNKSLDNGQNSKWLYQFKVVPHHIYYYYVGFDSPSTLQISLFQPINQWLWRFSEEVRDNPGAKSFTAKFTTDSVSSRGKDIAAYWLSSYVHEHVQHDWTLSVSLPYPPVLMVDKSLSLSKAGQSYAMDIGVGRDWTAHTDQDWCRVEPASGTGDMTRVNITVDENTTGASRKAIITFWTEDAEGTATTEVFQSQY